MFGTLVLMLLFGHSSTPAHGTETCGLDRLSWMAGAWSSDREGTSSEEIWSDAKGGIMLGVHRDTRGETLLGFEFLRIAKTEAGIAYLASPEGRPPTAFPLVECGERQAIFENRDHDFPNRILYRLDDEDRLHAVAEGLDEGDPRLEWIWVRTNEALSVQQATKVDQR